ncbi:Mg2+ transporter protein, CorA-like/Zinc transport protein ZntB [Cordyceps javanica]|uniref:Mg2+ transporter protein, CorA-like/Zinc transport protein ZntB n=1 Tax=Cordyceps javanica TaxID=43265 RepID=A0A545VEB2_9HYPO|nr:Mg2+ transporter protein, CorA-like/Zinc transport protein ZntB [Cordyceps javanica]
MDDYLFRQYVNECRVVHEETTYVEIFNYSVGGNLSLENRRFEKAYQKSRTLSIIPAKRGVCAARAASWYGPLERHSTSVSTEWQWKDLYMRIVADSFLHARSVQTEAQDKDTFMPKVLSLPKDAYENHVRRRTVLLDLLRSRRCRPASTYVLPATALISLTFLATNPWPYRLPHLLDILHRKSDVRKKGRTRGWEMMLSHCFATGVTTGFVKGTPSSDVVAALRHLRACAAQVGHPLLLPTILLAHDLSPANDQKQRDARDWLRRLEQAVSMRDEVEVEEQYFQNGRLEVDGLNRDLVECHSNVLWKRPQAYMALTIEMEKAMSLFKDMYEARRMLAENGKGENGEIKRYGGGGAVGQAASAREAQRRELDRLHRSMLARMDFYKVKLTGLENYIHTTLQRLKVQREWLMTVVPLQLYNIMSQREARLNLEIAGEQRRIAHASKRDSTAMKMISLLGTLFLPGTFLASVFSMTFFNFQSSTMHIADDGNSDADPVISDKLWVFFLLTIPITAAIVGVWIWYDRRKEAQYARDDEDLEKDITKMEHDIMLNLRKRTMSKNHTWNTISPPPR